MPKEIILFQKNELPFNYKFYTLMDLLISNQVESRVESFFFLSIFYLQIISSFFAEQIGVFDHVNSKSDAFLFYIQKIIRVKDLFKQNINGLHITIIIFFILIILAILHFLLTCLNMTRSSYYSFNKVLINYYIKIFIYLIYNVVCDLSFSIFCFGSSDDNPNFVSLSCSIKNRVSLSIIAIFTIIISLFLYIFIPIYYNDTFYLSNNYYSKMSCNYDLYMGLNCLVCSCLLTQVEFLTREIFFIYNLLVSVVLFIFYINHYLYYDTYINIFTGIFHILYVWSSLFSLIFAYINFKEKGVVYIITSIIVCFLYFNIKNIIESKIFLDTPYHKISNKFYLLYYLRSLVDKVNNVEENVDDKSFLCGTIQMHGVECPNPYCLLKTKEEIYLPSAHRWSKRSKKSIEDAVFLKNFLIVVMNYFLSIHECSVDMFLNLSLYYLKIIGNYCQAMYFYKKVTELTLTLKERFSFIRLNIQISKILVEKLKPSSEPCMDLKNLDVSTYYKYESLSRNFIDEISNDVNYSLEFWKYFRAPLKQSNKIIDFNRVFKLTDKIRIAKKNVEVMWNELLDIYKGVNDFFELYSEYVEEINDDDLKKRDLESLRKKNDNYGDRVNQNYYSVLFNKDTGIIIANGDKGSEGIIELANKEIELIFKYKVSDLKGMNLTSLMPKLFSKDHSKFIERYFKVGEKRLIDKPDFKSFGKDKNNSIVKMKIALKLFPILNENVFFVGLIVKENIDDIILMDENFIIQGMSLKLMKILNIENKFLFQDNEIPFYAICKKFIGFYSIFLQQGQKKPDNEPKKKQIIVDEDDQNNKNKEKEKKEEKNSDRDEIHQNIEINENVELEYEIKLPKFLTDYSEKTNKKEAKLGLQLISNVEESDEFDESIQDFNEDDLLMDENNEQKDNNIFAKNDKIKFSITPTPNGITPTPFGNTPTPGMTLTPTPGYEMESAFEDDNFKSGFNRQSDEEIIYNEKINQYKDLFEDKKFNELEDLIDLCNKESITPDYKFNFTFDRYKYGPNKQIAYIVRCIDNKNDVGKSEEESGGDLDPKAAKYKKEKADSIKPLFELLEEERKEILELPEIFLKLSLENKKFQKLLQVCKNDINTMSKTHGQKKDEVLEDENSSQTSQTGFDSGLVKKNRIEEIRSNLLMNISSFYTLQYIKLIIILIPICTIIFCSLYMVYFKRIYNNLIGSSKVNIYLFQTTLWTSELISIFISLRTLIMEKNIGPKKNFTFNDYINSITNNTIYYLKMQSYATKMYYNLSTFYGFLEMNIPKYLTMEELMQYYWDEVNVSYLFEKYKSEYNKTDDEAFPMSMAQLLSNCITYLNLNYLPEPQDLAPEKVVYINFMTYLIIENGYDNILKNQINKLLIIPDILTSYNKNEKSSLIIIIIVYGCAIIILCSAYYFFIQLTSKSMTSGLEKVTKIKLEKIEETIKNIETFNNNLKKIKDKDTKLNEENKENSDMNEDQNNINNYKNPEEAIKNTIIKTGVDSSSIVGSNGFNTDYKKYIPLTVLNYSLVQALIFFLILCVFLILIYIFSNKMVDNTNKLLLVQNYIFGKLISTSISTLEIKCYMSECKNSTKLNYGKLVDMSKIQEVIKGINNFDEVSDFYNYKFLLNACGAAIDKNKEEKRYNSCMIDSLIKSANNTDNLLKLIEDIVDNIIKEIEIRKGTNVTLRDGTSAKFIVQYLYNSTDFNRMEYIFYNYIIDVGDNFETVVDKNLNKYLKNIKIFIVTLVYVIGICVTIYCLIFGILFIRKLIHYLSISRCIMKIIPTSVIISTQELETWIENKY